MPTPDPTPNELPAVSPIPAPARLAAPGAFPADLAAPRPAPPQGAVVWAVLAALSRRWKQTVLFGLLLAVPAAAAVWFFLPPPKPTATARLWAPLKPMTPLGGEHPDPPMDRSTQISLLRSQLVLSAALRKPEIANLPVIKEREKERADPIDWLSKNLTITSEGPEVLALSLSLDDGEQARLLVDAVKDAFLTDVVGEYKTQRKIRLDRLKQIDAATDEVLRRKRASARKLAETGAGGDLKLMALRQALAQEKLIGATKELNDIQTRIRRLKIDEANFLAQAGGGPAVLSEKDLQQIVELDPEVKANRQKREELEKQQTALIGSLKDPEHNAQYKLLMGNLERNKAEFDRLEKKIREREQASSQAKSKAEAEHRLAAIKQQIQDYQMLEQALQTDVARFQEDVTKQQVAPIDQAAIQMEIDQANKLSERIKGQITTLELELDVEPRIKELEKATISRPDAERKKLLFTGGGALAALALVGTLIGFLEVRQKRVESPDTVTRGLGLRVVGTVPKPPSILKRLPGGTAADRWEAVLTEAINCTRTMLLHAEGFSSVRVLQVTSSVSGEGKTTLAAHLAVSLALAGRKTLLVDGDLRNPNAHRPFNLPAGPGLCEVLRGEVALHDVVHSTPVAGLTVLPAGRYDADTLRTLADTGPDDLFARLRQEFDIVIIDSSPVLPVTDPLLLARHTDGVIVSLLQGVSRLPLVEETNQRLTALGVRVLGAVVNGTNPRAYGYGGSYPLPAKA